MTETGRRDGVVSYLAGATASMPLSTQKIPDLEAMFVQAGLDINDLVILSGGSCAPSGYLESRLNRLMCEG